MEFFMHIATTVCNMHPYILRNMNFVQKKSVQIVKRIFDW